ncbi:hypothetical protein PSENEW3n2_00002173 [Picochlorum sp. SENEW3]|nr:hypothetical protein PSENEW3n2_00002173 [Picochlorum sp. SENEW3]WPT15809.1 hypothetical protein PSENEW3_00002173 [Picochlorum sp. SENEW3]
MCRVAVRQASARAHRQAEQENAIRSSNESVQGNGGHEYFDVDALLGELDQSSADADFAFMQYLNSGIVPQATVPQEQQLNVVQGQPVGYTSQQTGSYVQPMMMMPTQPSADYVDHHSMNNNYLGGYQMHQQQIMSPGMQQDSVNGASDDGAKDMKEKPAKRARGKKTKKTPEEIAEQVERVKRRRRESAHRSRQKRFAYIQNLETENQALKMENERLRQMLSSSKTTAAPKDDGSVDSLESMENKKEDMYVKSEAAGSSSALIDSTFNDIMCKATSQEIAMAADLLGIKAED